VSDEDDAVTDDARVLERAAAGDRHAFDEFVQRHAPAVLRYVRLRTTDPDAAEDALQETFIAAWRNAGSFRGDGSARAWLLTIARNAVHRQYRRAAGEPEAHEPLAALAVRAGWGRNPDDGWTEQLTARELIDRGFGRLSADEREILLLRDLEGFSTAELARLLQLSVPAGKSRLHRARLRFMESVREIS
jgi:RNA polymerase sigma-70 factor, ECF subfamily